MASARNRVIAGNYDGKYLKYGFSDRYVTLQKVSSCDTKLVNSYGDLQINKFNVKSYEIITEEKMKSGSSAILRGTLGAAVLGPIGLLAGLTAKNKGIHTIAIEWKDEKKSLIEVDEKLYKQLIQDLF